jgi:predicted amidohydrolase YtcJ
MNGLTENLGNGAATADLTLYNGKIHTMNPSMDTVEAVVVKDGKIVFTGSSEAALRQETATRIDLAGRSVLPGFIDSHIHCVTYAWYENSVKLHKAKSVADVVSAARAHMQSRSFADGKWMIGRGWNEYNFDVPAAFTKADLDSVSADIPIAFLRVCGHSCVVNSKALEIILKLDKAQPLLHEIDVESGLLREGAARLFLDAIPPFDAAELAELIRYAAEKLNACGITSIHSDDLRSLPVKSPYETIAAFRSLAEAGDLNVRVCSLNSYDNRAQLDAYIADGYKTGDGDEMFRIGPVKIITDGSLGSKTAAMNEPYADDANAFGILHYDQEALTDFVNHCRANGLDVTIHAIGDRAMENAVRAVKASNEQFGFGRRHGVLHSQVAMAETLEEMGRQGMQAFIQPVFVGSDMDTAERLLSNPSGKKLYAWKSMLDSGMAVSGSACSPVEPFDVLENIQYAVTREKLSGGPAGGWIPEEKLSVEEAIRLFTVNGAYASYEEDMKGTIEVGKLADMVVLTDSPLEVSPYAIKDIRVDCTILGGRIVYADNT